MFQPVEVTDRTIRDQLEKRKKPVVLHVWARGCSASKVVGPAVIRLASRDDRFTLLIADISELPETTDRLGIDRTPAMIMFQDGAEVARTGGWMLEARIARWLDRNLAGNPRD
ncbi:MAG: thioredoxin family protein [Gammaproteobacteria bacterium]|nr:thioredoxin family protein [Gammaproteobacteria bacterium]